ncbi:ABC transporter ATP-binding protein [Plantibacter sp. VKM Ac-2885]|uniref:Iron complex transport system ATP-binding protein n=2 Tax=Plantibacter TaxID=190323 RepID=A0A3N2BYU1_9MICO|nr:MULTISPECIES: ABC transporter ATP-binding protein [Plantibacter]AZH82618.1 ABC transporter ATP-binding protein [Plantibacter sp. PA-3-X8]MBD8101547.1 ABC transporter ATP-binding protein [Plantibacter sp. CFBP 8775]MBD8465375.1 ABC transporter ATP-binding protein [Plantibacter sp. CFBP 8798]MBD8517879.1 ABC transporter ATP-binding protein [Plantibacter sp. CFBP 8804]MBF4511612.1 ABC transporter ATP-binding protein [Plantibacter sp. VKM Ac-2885]
MTDPATTPSLVKERPTPALEARGVSLAYDQTVVFEGLDLRIETGEVTTLIGANGCGKSTLLKAFGRLLTPTAGTVELDGRGVRSIPTREVARRLAILPQKPLTPSATTVRDLVSRGRHPHQSLLKPWTPADTIAVDEALAATGLETLADRDTASLSGGQLQRAWIALVLAQRAPTILLDEPTTFLDLSHQLDVLRLVRSINRERGATVVMVLHDLTLAGRYSDRLVVVGGGRVIADGTPWEVLTPAVLREAFDLDAIVIPDPSSGSPLIVPVDPDDAIALDAE